ncbi:MAG: DUF4388 domain-containing protein [Myxococcota bacterium]|nr:DUF4388 domain-containing protein [Myxococcota bacterium]
MRTLAFLGGIKPATMVTRVRPPSPRQVPTNGTGPPPSIPELLVALREVGESGVLEVRAGGVCTRIHLRAGEPVFAEGGALRETLGRMLVRHGEIAQDDYVRVVERMTERLVDCETIRMGEVLIELGILSPVEVFEALSRQIVEKIGACFRWSEFEYRFELGTEVAEENGEYACPPLELLVLSGIRDNFGPDQLDPIMKRHSGHRVRLDAEPGDLVRRFQLTPAEQKLLLLLAEGKALATVLAASPLSREQTAQLVAALTITRAAGFAAIGGSAGSHAAPAWPQAAGSAAAKQGLMWGGSLAGLRREVDRARRTASSGDAKVNERTDCLRAERAYQRAKLMFESGALAGARHELVSALELQSGEPEYEMLLAWIELQLARGDDERAAARAQAERVARTVLEQDRENVRAHVVLGQLAFAAGDAEAASRHFSTAARIAPNDHDAQRGLRMLERRKGRSG